MKTTSNKKTLWIFWVFQKAHLTNGKKAKIIKIVIANLKQQELSYKAFADEIERKAE